MTEKGEREGSRNGGRYGEGDRGGRRRDRGRREGWKEEGRKTLKDGWTESGKNVWRQESEVTRSTTLTFQQSTHSHGVPSA